MIRITLISHVAASATSLLFTVHMVTYGQDNLSRNARHFCNLTVAAAVAVSCYLRPSIQMLSPSVLMEGDEFTGNHLAARLTAVAASSRDYWY